MPFPIYFPAKNCLGEVGKPHLLFLSHEPFLHFVTIRRFTASNPISDYVPHFIKSSFLFSIFSSPIKTTITLCTLLTRAIRLLTISLSSPPISLSGIWVQSTIYKKLLVACMIHTGSTYQLRASQKVVRYVNFHIFPTSAHTQGPGR